MYQLAPLRSHELKFFLHCSKNTFYRVGFIAEPRIEINGNISKTQTWFFRLLRGIESWNTVISCLLGGRHGRFPCGNVSWNLHIECFNNDNCVGTFVEPRGEITLQFFCLLNHPSRLPWGAGNWNEIGYDIESQGICRLPRGAGNWNLRCQAEFGMKYRSVPSRSRELKFRRRRKMKHEYLSAPSWSRELKYIYARMTKDWKGRLPRGVVSWNTDQQNDQP